MIINYVKLPKMKQEVKFELSHNQHALLMPMSDFHMGSDSFLKDRLVNHIKWGNERGAIYLGLGDYLDNLSATQRDIVKRMRRSSQLALDKLAHNMVREVYEDVLKPATGRFIGLLSGNHRWVYSDNSGFIDSDQELASLLQCTYLGTSTITRMFLEKTSPTKYAAHCDIFAHHGKSGGQLMGSQLNSPEKALGFCGQDIVLNGHSHGKIVGTKDQLELTRDGAFYHRTRLAARTGGFMKGYTKGDLEGNYVEQAMMAPSSLGGICIGIGAIPIRGSKYDRLDLHYSV
jgi:hypothetical protein